MKIIIELFNSLDENERKVSIVFAAFYYDLIMIFHYVNVRLNVLGKKWNNTEHVKQSEPLKPLSHINK